MKNTATVGVIFGLLALGQAKVAAINGLLEGVFKPGQNLFANPYDSGSNLLSSLFQPLPEGTTVELWDSVAGAYTISSTYTSGAWTSDLALPVGLGARLTLTGLGNVTNYFAGLVLTGDGTPTGPGDGLADFVPPSQFTGMGTFLLASITALDLPLDPSGPHGTTNSVWNWVIGRDPLDGEQFLRTDPDSGTFITSFGSGTWSNGEPMLSEGQAAFFTVNIPEPTSAALLGLAGGALLVLRRRR